ncbi:hypothetical protein [Vibrio gazogenes]|uniref:Uncharacterized protein n=1 Tax=Vibrio gazogenes DSM 21264 = NBRC 103151 TaxID=1123492 RepID=A0A1M5ATF4_VIBGA|nr:hypothetical protein [Vibrio gazogenes]USP12705.1 hypothetical protein MKS89_09635 [Vibrio gazogenes]SHF33531.1 hypothetical protein SAMN02745781_02025 [Vibrio gazogenes DSM 21264] [Vibrio gazogenes DSM 21264 = NBRC 103151]SJN58635.1 hypothetical protein BQ6471_03118 [Vibrio gazogenes]
MKLKTILTFSLAGLAAGMISPAKADTVCRTPNIVCSGQTTSGDTSWQQYPNGAGIYVDIDTSACELTSMPTYMTSMNGNNTHWEVTGTTSIYNATETGFRVYIRYTNGRALTPATANGFQWSINWIALSSADCPE